jgi:hypothetical protein
MADALKASRGPDKSQRWFSLAAALGKPTRTGAFGETLGNAAEALGAYTGARSEAKQKGALGLAELEYKYAADQDAATQKQGLEAMKLLAKGKNGGDKTSDIVILPPTYPGGKPVAVRKLFKDGVPYYQKVGEDPATGGSLIKAEEPAVAPAPKGADYPIQEVTGKELADVYGRTGYDPETRYRIHTAGSDAGKVEEIAVDPLQKYGDLTGPALLEALDPKDRAEVQALYEGRIVAPTAGGRAKEGQRLLSLATAAFPDFDASIGKQRFKIRQDYTPGGSVGKNIASFNTVAGHLGSLAKASDDLGNLGGIFTSLNPIKNWAAQKTGKPEIKTFLTARTAVADELVRAFRGTGGTLTEIQDWQKKFDDASSPEQLKAAITEATNLLGSRIDALVVPYNQAMGTNRSFLSFMTPQARKTLMKLNPTYELTDDDKKYLVEEESQKRKTSTPAPAKSGSAERKTLPPPGGKSNALPASLSAQYAKVPPANRAAARERLKAAGYDISGLK